MNPKFKVLYVIAGTLALLLVVYQLFTDKPSVYIPRLILKIVMSLFFYYLAYKTYHEKKDKELM
ncbi:MAG TPA: hypothetical protein VFE53_12585 [Mucilaginibacter sp.]|jgi:hypothetical protein|nr:hypothetical protein [Mucilaginibacter sp.]